MKLLGIALANVGTLWLAFAIIPGFPSFDRFTWASFWTSLGIYVLIWMGGILYGKAMAVPPEGSK